MSWCWSVWVHLVWDPLCFLYLDILILLSIWENFKPQFLHKHFLFPFLSLFSFWDPYNANVGTFDVILEILYVVLFFVVVVFPSAVLIGWFPLFYLLDHLCILLCHLVCYSFLLEFFYFLIYLIYLFFAVLALCCCMRAFSSCGEWGLLFVVVRGLLIVVVSLCCGAWALGAWASVAVACGL